MSNLTVALVFVLSVNALLFLAQASVMDLNPSGGEFYTGEGSLISNFAKDKDLDAPILDTDATTTNLPEAEGSLSPETGNFFTDSFSSIRRWFTSIPGINYIYGIAIAPYNMLKIMNLPNSFVWAVGSLWYGVTLFLIVAFFWGKE